jgi:hypothetical protein
MTSFFKINATSEEKYSSIVCNEGFFIKIYPIYPRINLNSIFERPG